MRIIIICFFAFCAACGMDHPVELVTDTGTVDAGPNADTASGTPPNRRAKCHHPGNRCADTDGGIGICNSQMRCLPCAEFPYMDKCPRQEPPAPDPDLSDASPDAADVGIQADSAGETADAGHPDAASSDTFAFCETDADCDAEEVCNSQGLCLLEDEAPDVNVPDPIEECPDEHTCSVGETCSSQGFCVPAFPVCPHQHTCASGEVCTSQGLCIPDRGSEAPDAGTSPADVGADTDSTITDVGIDMSDVGQDTDVTDSSDSETDATDTGTDADTDTDAGCQVKTWYRDENNDGYGNPYMSTESCTKPQDYVATPLCGNDADGVTDSDELLCPIDADGDGVEEKLCFSDLLFMEGPLHQTSDACVVGHGFGFSFDYVSNFDDADCDAVAPKDRYFCVDFWGRSFGNGDLTLVSHVDPPNDPPSTDWWRNDLICDSSTVTDLQFAQDWCTETSPGSYLVQVAWQPGGLSGNGDL